MILFKNPLVVITAILVCVVIFYLANTMNFFGKLANKFMPCEENILSSAPCYAGFDIGIMIASALLGITFMVILAIQLLK
jgi:hypothetical protein